MMVWSVCFSATAQNVAGDTGTKIRYLEEEEEVKREFKQKLETECGVVRPIRVGGFSTNPPFGWVDVIPGDGVKADSYENDGLGFQLFESMAKTLGYKTDNVGFKSYYEAVQALKYGQIDVLLGSYYDKRTLGVGTSILFPGYFANPIVVAFIKGKEKEIKTLSDLSGLKGVVRQEEGIYSLMHQSWPDDVPVQQISGARKAFTALLTGEADFMVTSLYAAEAEIRRFKIADKIHLTNIPLKMPELFFVFSSISDCMPLKSEFETQIVKEKQNNQINALLFKQIDKWIDRFRYNESLIHEMNNETETLNNSESSSQ